MNVKCWQPRKIFKESSSTPQGEPTQQTSARESARGVYRKMRAHRGEKKHNMLIVSDKEVGPGWLVGVAGWGVCPLPVKVILGPTNQLILASIKPTHKQHNPPPHR